MMVGMWGGEGIESLFSKGLTTHRPKADIGGVNLSKAFLFTKRIVKFVFNMKINPSTWKKIIQFIITILTTIAGTIAVQSCMAG